MKPSSVAPLFAVVIAAWAAACQSASGDGDTSLTPGTDSGTTETGGGDGSPTEDTAPVGPFDDFPSEAVVEEGAPAGSKALFEGAGSEMPSGGPCLLEPQPGSLFPRNFLRPRFRLTPPSGHNLFEIRLHTETQKNDLVVYTTSPIWTMPATMWTGLSAHSIDKPITMSVRSAVYDSAAGTLSGLAIGSSGTFTIAPAEASGSIVYWVIPGGAAAVSQLKGFAVGDESVKLVLEPSQIPTSQCIGCHASTPDGQFVATSSSDTAGDGSGPSWVELRSVKDASVPSFLTPAAKALLARKNQHGVSFSKAHWSAGDRIMLSHQVVGDKTQIVWTDLEAKDEATGSGVITREGDANAAGGAAFSHDGKNIVYFSAPAIGASVIDGAGQSDLFVVPYGDKKGGAAKRLFEDAAHASFYPQYSADDQLIAFNQVPRGETTYNNKNAELFVVPAGGGERTRLAANDPPSCMGVTSPGITNSWPKWSPAATVSGATTYYWLTFSSTRGAGNPQIYVAPITVTGGKVTSYPALYLWNQPDKEHNHTPAWDVFSLPIK